MFLSSKEWLKYVLTISLAVTPLVGTTAVADAGSSSCEKKISALVTKCQNDNEAVNIAMAGDISVNNNGTQGGVRNNSGAYNRASARRSAAAQSCEAATKECKEECQGEDLKKCQKAVATVADQMRTQSVADGENGGNMGAIAGLMGAALGAAMGMMMAKKDKQQPQQMPQPVATGALQLNGSLNCQMQDSYRYEDCASFLTTYCSAQATAAAAGTTTATPMTGTVISQPGGTQPMTPDCASFNASYCSTQVTPPQPYGMARMDGAVTQVNMAGTGEGLGSQYCARTVATSWCSDPSRALCPTCRQAEAYASPTCAANPALCLTQTSPQQIQAAQNNPACSGDPLFTPGSPYAVSGTLPTNMAGTTTGGGGLPTVVLPASNGTANGGGTGVTVTGNGGGTTGGSGGGPSFGKNYGQPVTGIAVTSEAGIREGQALSGSKSASSGGSSGGGFGGTPLKTGSAHAHASTNELIAAGGVILAGSSAPTRGPASDVESQFGPSLFATSSQVIRQHCQAGKLMNCP